MKKLLTALLLLASTLSFAQQYDVLDQIKADPRKAWGMEGPHRFDAPALSPAPKGYKPFYISHYGRHGSRYAWNSKTYSLIREVLEAAHAQQALTPLGEEFYTRFMDFYAMPLINTGDLVPLGWEQHQKIGAWVYDSFPAVFTKGKKVDAVVSTSARSIVSMSSFCLALKGKSPKLEFYQSSTHEGMLIAAPTSAPKPLRRSFREDDLGGIESVAHFNARFVDYDGILGRIFKDPGFPARFSGGRHDFLFQCYALVSGYHNYEPRPLFDGLFTPEQMAMLWEADSYASYVTDLSARYGNIPLLEDVISKAEAAFQSPSQAADLRFGHDYVAEAFLALINANGCGTRVEKATDAKYWFQSFNIPMATTILFVFYRNRKGDILFKLIWNEAEATLPQLTPVSGPYYRWTDFTAWAAGMMAAHPEIKD